MVKKMIEEKQEYGWQFLFMGANMDAVTEAQKIGIRASHAVTYKNDSEGVRLNYQAAHRVMACLIERFRCFKISFKFGTGRYSPDDIIQSRVDVLFV